MAEIPHRVSLYICGYATRLGLLSVEPLTTPGLRGNLGIAMEQVRFHDRMRAVLRTRHYSIRTEDTFVQWGRRFILFHGKKHPSERR